MGLGKGQVDPALVDQKTNAINEEVSRINEACKRFAPKLTELAETTRMPVYQQLSKAFDGFAANVSTLAMETNSLTEITRAYAAEATNVATGASGLNNIYE